MKNLLVAQSGGPTSAINATLAGVVENALSSPSVDRIYGSINGIQGVLTENLIDLKTKITNVSELDLLCQTPASALGSCRVKLKDPAVCADEYETIISVLRKYNIDCFIYIGGNDSMDTVDKLSKYLNAKGITDITVVVLLRPSTMISAERITVLVLVLPQNISELHLPSWNATATYTQLKQ
mgnify:CR=1 FL=1